MTQAGGGGAAEHEQSFATTVLHGESLPRLPPSSPPKLEAPVYPYETVFPGSFEARARGPPRRGALGRWAPAPVANKQPKQRYQHAHTCVDSPAHPPPPRLSATSTRGC